MHKPFSFLFLLSSFFIFIFRWATPIATNLQPLRGIDFLNFNDHQTTPKSFKCINPFHFYFFFLHFSFFIFRWATPIATNLQPLRGNDFPFTKPYIFLFSLFSFLFSFFIFHFSFASGHPFHFWDTFLCAQPSSEYKKEI